MKHWSIRNGVWVESDQGVGILRHQRVVKPSPDAPMGVPEVDAAGRPTGRTEPWIHLVNDDGSTLAQIPAERCSNVRQASAAAIPKSRVEHMTAEQLAAIGYF